MKRSTTIWDAVLGSRIRIGQAQANGFGLVSLTIIFVSALIAGTG